jgi:uncharacterized protein YkwD
MKKPCNLALQLVVFCFGMVAVCQFAQAARYKDFAASLVQSLPAGAQFRPDLEALLAQYANTYRAQQGKVLLTPSDQFLMPARAHAADMMLHNFLGHRASTGHDFDSRMRAFVDDITRYPNMAENAARDSQNTPVDKAKARRVLQQWIDSPPHHKTLISPDYAFFSTAVVQRGQKIWAVQIFWAKPRDKGFFQ